MTEKLHKHNHDYYFDKKEKEKLLTDIKKLKEMDRAWRDFHADGVSK